MNTNPALGVILVTVWAVSIFLAFTVWLAYFIYKVVSWLLNKIR